MVLSSGAATKNVCGGRLRSTMRGSLAQLASNARAAPAIARRARDQKYLRKGILRSLRGVRDAGRFSSGTGYWGPVKTSNRPGGCQRILWGGKGEKPAGRKQEGPPGDPAALSR